jgi:hypothetical protein
MVARSKTPTELETNLMSARINELIRWISNPLVPGSNDLWLEDLWKEISTRQLRQKLLYNYTTGLGYFKTRTKFLGKEPK